MKLKSTLMTLGLAAFMAAPLVAREHPTEHPVQLAEHPAEHPTQSSAKSAEHPGSGSEHPAKDKAKHDHSKHSHDKKSSDKVTLKDVSRSVKKFVALDSKTKGGKFMVWDDKQNKALALEFDKVHEDRLSSIGNDTYFVCADFTDTDGTVYDLDLFMKGTNPKRLRVSDVVSVHKKNGKARYGWEFDKTSNKWKKTK